MDSARSAFRRQWLGLSLCALAFGLAANYAWRPSEGDIRSHLASCPTCSGDTRTHLHCSELAKIAARVKAELPSKIQDPTQRPPLVSPLIPPMTERLEPQSVVGSIVP